MIMKLIDNFSRILVGGLFIFSGLIKINDPIGTKIKLEEYFVVFSSDFASFFEGFVPFALPIGMILIVLEIVLGVAVLMNYKMEKSTWILLVLILFFTFLTFYSAYFNKVTDCGCFGDAIPLTPWQSFYKDIILVVFIAHLFWYRRKYESFVRNTTGGIVIISVTVLSFAVGYYALEHLPFIDFRPYKVGNNVPALMLPEENPIFEYTFEKQGELITSKEYLSEAEGYVYKDIKVVNEDKTIPKITDYQVISPEGEDFTQSSFEGVKLIFIIHELHSGGISKVEDIAILANNVQGKIDMMLFTSAMEEEVNQLKKENDLKVPHYFLDQTVLKAMIRSNPGIFLLKGGTVLGKWHINDIPDESEIANLL